ncbi:hypothetical protein Tco_0484411 [Tanacetum coccineum]
MQDDSIPDEQVHLSDDEDSENDHLPKADSRKDWWKPLPEEERPTTPEPTWTIPSSNKSDVANNWASALATTCEHPAENSLLAKTGDMTTFLKCLLTIAITTVLINLRSTVDSLIMEDEHLDTIPVTESEEVIKSSVENLVQIPSESKGISDGGCDVPLCDNPTPLEAFKEHSETIVDYNNDSTSKQPIPLSETFCFNLEEISSGSTTTRSDLSLPDYEFFYLDDDHIEEKSSGSTTTHADFSQYDSFIFDLSIDSFPPADRRLTSVVIFDNSNDPLLELPEFELFHFNLYNDPSFPRPPLEPPDVEICLIIKTEAPVINNFDELNEDECFDPGGGEINISQNVEDDDSFIFVIRTFLSYFTYPEDSPLLLSTGSEDTIFDSDIST